MRLLDGEPSRWPPANGAYWRQNSTWWCITPNGLYGNLSAHSVTEHEDGTITVAPSILVTGHDRSWHGYLEKGVWRNV